MKSILFYLADVARGKFFLEQALKFQALMKSVFKLSRTQDRNLPGNHLKCGLERRLEDP
jgi:hypothetical protein